MAHEAAQEADLEAADAAAVIVEAAGVDEAALAEAAHREDVVVGEAAQEVEGELLGEGQEEEGEWCLIVRDWRRRRRSRLCHLLQRSNGS